MFSPPSSAHLPRLPHPHPHSMLAQMQQAALLQQRMLQELTHQPTPNNPPLSSQLCMEEMNCQLDF